MLPGLRRSSPKTWSGKSPPSGAMSKPGYRVWIVGFISDSKWGSASDRFGRSSQFQLLGGPRPVLEASPLDAAAASPVLAGRMAKKAASECERFCPKRANPGELGFDACRLRPETVRSLAQRFVRELVALNQACCRSRGVMQAVSCFQRRHDDLFVCRARCGKSFTRQGSNWPKASGSSSIPQRAQAMSVAATWRHGRGIGEIVSP